MNVASRTMVLFTLLLVGTGCGESEAQKRIREENAQRIRLQAEAYERRMREQKEEEQKLQEGLKKRELERIEEAKAAKLLEEELEKKRQIETEKKRVAEEERRKKLAALIQDALALPDVPAPAVTPTGLKGKVLIADKFNGWHLSHDKLPAGLKGDLDDPDLLVFLVTEYSTRPGSRSYKVQTNPDPLSGARPQSLTVGSAVNVVGVRVIDWKAKRVLGTFKVEGDEPAEFARIPKGESFGGPIKGPPVDLTAWVAEICRDWQTPYEKVLAAKDAPTLRALIDTGACRFPRSAAPGLGRKLADTKDNSMRYELIRVINIIAVTQTTDYPTSHAKYSLEVPAPYAAFNRDPDGFVGHWSAWALRQK